MKRYGAVAATLTAAALGLVAGGALAQSGAPAQPPQMRQVQPGAAPATARPAAAPSQPAASAPSYGGGGGSDDSSGTTAPVYRITGVELMRSTMSPPLDVIRVWGVSTTDGWDTPTLVPLTRGPSADGMLDLLMVADSPGRAISPTPFGALEAIFVVESGHPYRGIRVRSATNSVSLTKLPGAIQVAAPTQDCTQCVGKVFVARGAAAPAGAAATDIVREEDLPATLRVVRPNDGIASIDSNPNRLSLMLGDDGRIVLAVWD
jgi:hypothetical protein